MTALGLNRRDGFIEGLTAGMFGSAVCTSALLYLLRQQDLVSFSAMPMPAVLRNWRRERSVMMNPLQKCVVIDRL